MRAVKGAYNRRIVCLHLNGQSCLLLPPMLLLGVKRTTPLAWLAHLMTWPKTRRRDCRPRANHDEGHGALAGDSPRPRPSSALCPT